MKAGAFVTAALLFLVLLACQQNVDLGITPNPSDTTRIDTSRTPPPPPSGPRQYHIAEIKNLNSTNRRNFIYDAATKKLKTVTHLYGVITRMDFQYKTDGTLKTADYVSTYQQFHGRDSFVYNQEGKIYLVYQQRDKNRFIDTFKYNAMGLLATIMHVADENKVSRTVLEYSPDSNVIKVTEFYKSNTPDEYATGFTRFSNYDSSPNPFRNLVHPNYTLHYICNFKYHYMGQQDYLQLSRNNVGRIEDYTSEGSLHAASTISYLYDSTTRYPIRIKDAVELLNDIKYSLN